MPACPEHPELEERVKQLLNRVTEAGSAEATTLTLDERGAEELATEIRSLFHAVTPLTRHPVNPDSLVGPEDVS